MIKVTEFYKEIRAGSSLPLIVGGSDGQKYVVKPRGSGEGTLANIAEFLSLQLGRLAQIPVLEPVGLWIEVDFAKKASDPEIRELLEKSAGINLGTKYVEAASVYHATRAPFMAPEMKDHIFLYDLFLLNVDRNASNPNIIFNRAGLWCLDYASAVTMRNVVTGNGHREFVLLKEIKRHLFYRENIDAYSFIRKFREIPDNDINAVIDELPEEWLAALKVVKTTKSFISKRLIEEKNNVAVLLKRLDMLRILRLETEEERRLKALENRRAFEKKFGKL